MYITIEEFEKSLPANLRALLSSDNGEIQNNEVIQEVIEYASSMIDSYASYRYVVPITNITPQIKAVCVDIAVYRLFNRKNALSKETIENYKMAIDYLKDISIDKARIENAQMLSSNNLDTSNNVYAKSISDEPKFDVDNLEGWKIV